MQPLPYVGAHSVGFYSSQHLLTFFTIENCTAIGPLWKWRCIHTIMASHHWPLTWESSWGRWNKWCVLSRPVIETTPFCLQLNVPCSVEIKKFRSRTLDPRLYLNLFLRVFFQLGNRDSYCLYFAVLLLVCRWITQGHTEILWDNWTWSLAYSINPWISFHEQFF